MKRIHPATIAGLTAKVIFREESWTTCRLSRHEVGTVVSLYRGNGVRSVVLTAIRIEDVPGDTFGWVIGTAVDLATGEPEDFKVRGNLCVLTRCDLYYLPGDGS
ncbi:hypothetical protein LHJ74_14680 [Streptomyces sp. N2-109]|uniref:Uncharacterized protein n=1 Tax=Streptomyces gossypii TaxID=2883101 RepID=A0ABT2JTC5_9ACTN|nr:hypothetical protein [Streptomyces gossypii]MCT2591137.1 hypothetical protein [Streptomyces gossypii]